MILFAILSLPFGFIGLRMPANRCSDCGINYPTEYQSCLGCEGETENMQNAKPHEDFAQLAFEKFYTRWEIDRLERDISI